jgi:UDP-N-acetylglucosamine 1-carboxyvinyltransferase
VIHNIGQIERGYERIDERLRAVGAQIERADDGGTGGKGGKEGGA